MCPGRKSITRERASTRKGVHQGKRVSATLLQMKGDSSASLGLEEDTFLSRENVFHGEPLQTFSTRDMSALLDAPSSQKHGI